MVLPIDFERTTRDILGEKEYDSFIKALSETAPVSIRMNPFKHNTSIKSSLAGNGRNVEWCKEGYYLDQRFTFTFDPLLHAGYYYVQEASSMIIEQVIKQYIPERVCMLDLCAAPGGKSTHLRSRLPDGSLLISNEIIKSRSHILAENLLKWGHPDIIVTNNEPADFRNTLFFDAVLTDVPCSGEGMFRKDPAAINEWSPENVKNCQQRQRRIIDDIWPSIKPGGLLIYSTCTYNTQENEENILWIKETFGGVPLKLDIPKEWNVTTGINGYDLPVYRFFPHKTKGEGFFLAVIRKPSDADFISGKTTPKSGMKSKDLKQSNNKKQTIPDSVKSWIKESDRYDFFMVGDQLYTIKAKFKPELEKLKFKLNMILPGIPVGYTKGKEIKPQHALAMNTIMQDNVFPVVDLTWEEAISYLRKEPLMLPSGTERGFVLVTYNNTPLGFVNQVGNRANNLYPQEWRIRSGHIPDGIRILCK